MKPLLFAVLLTGATSVTANPTPYAGEQARPIKALSAQQVEDYLNGRGLGYAKAAELNHYPGPRHVLDLSAELALSEVQRAESERLFSTMQRRASALGAELVAKEAELDRRFASGSIDEQSLNKLLEAIGALQGQIRFTHLQAHLAQKALLSADQVARYDQLRGYAAASGAADKGGHRSGHQGGHHH